MYPRPFYLFNSPKYLCITLLLCMCSSAEQSWTKYFQIVRSGISRFCFLKCLIMRERSPASASSSTMLSSFSSMKEARYLITFGWSSCCNSWISFMQSSRAWSSVLRVEMGKTQILLKGKPCYPSSQRSGLSWAPPSFHHGKPLPDRQHWKQNDHQHNTTLITKWSPTQVSDIKKHCFTWTDPCQSFCRWWSLKGCRMESPSQNAEMYIGKNCYKHYIWDMIHDTWYCNKQWYRFWPSVVQPPVSHVCQPYPICTPENSLVDLSRFWTLPSGWLSFQMYFKFHSN